MLQCPATPPLPSLPPHVPVVDGGKRDGPLPVPISPGRLVRSTRQNRCSCLNSSRKGRPRPVLPRETSPDATACFSPASLTILPSIAHEPKHSTERGAWRRPTRRRPAPRPGLGRPSPTAPRAARAPARSCAAGAPPRIRSACRCRLRRSPVAGHRPPRGGTARQAAAIDSGREGVSVRAVEPCGDGVRAEAFLSARRSWRARTIPRPRPPFPAAILSRPPGTD